MYPSMLFLVMVGMTYHCNAARIGYDITTLEDKNIALCETVEEETMCDRCATMTRSMGNNEISKLRCCYVEETRDLCRACVDNPLICTTIMRYEWTMAGQSESTQEIKTPKPNSGSGWKQRLMTYFPLAAAQHQASLNTKEPTNTAPGQSRPQDQLPKYYQDGHMKRQSSRVLTSFDRALNARSLEELQLKYGGNRNTVRHGDGMRLRRSADESDLRVRRSAGCSPTTSSPISWFDRMCILAGYCSPQDLSDAPLDPNNCIPL